MTGHVVAWIAIVASGLGLAALACFALRRWRRTRWAAAALVFTWAATPFHFGDGHLAPALAVFVFRRFLEEGANPRPPLALLVVATVCSLLLFYAALGARALRRRVGRR